MSPSGDASAIKRFFKKLDVAVPCHYHSFPIIEPDADKCIAGMKGGRTRVVMPEKGKAFSV